MKLIGICGKARSGKDTAARYLAGTLNLHQYSFASPLKDMLTTVFGDHFYEGDRERICPETGKSYRVMMQTLGTEWGRELNEDIWVNLVNKKWEEVKQVSLHDPHGYRGMVLSDVRFDDEAEWVISQGGIVIEVMRDEVDKISGIPNHASEQGLSADITRWPVLNNSDLPNLYRQLEQVVREAYVR